MTPRVQRIALVRLTSLGDVVHALPVAAAIRTHRPDVEIVWIVEEHEQALLAANPCVDHVIVAPLRRWRRMCAKGHIGRTASEVGSFIKAIRSRPIDAVLDIQGWGHKTSPIVALTRAPHRIGFSARYARDRISPLFTTVHVTPPPDATHIVDQNLALLKPLGIEARAAEFVLPAWTDAGERVHAWTTARGLQPGAFIALLPSTRGRKKLWPAAAYAELAQRLAAATSLPIVIAGGPSDAAVLATVSAIDSSFHVFAPEPISDLAALLSRPRIVIGNDTGPLHLAAAANVRTLGLFGPTYGARNGPYGPRGRFIQSGTRRMDDIAVDVVFDTSMSMLRQLQ